MLALRTLLKHPRFSLISAGTLALGISAVAAIFSVVKGVLLEPLPYRDAARLVNVWSHAPNLGYDQFPLSPDLFFVYERENQVFESMALFQGRRANLSGEGSPEVVDTLVATHTYLTTLGAGMAAGRPYGAEHDVPGAERVAVISHRAWVNRFARRDVVGQSVTLDGQPHLVIGVTEPAIDTRTSPEFFVPARLNRENPIVGNFGWNAIARLKPGVTAGDATAHLKPIVQKFMDAMAVNTYRAFLSDGGYAPRANPMREDLVGDLERPLWILLGTVGGLLLIACANVTNLFLVRAEGRQREIAVRGALGASRWSLVRLVVAESAVLAVAGSVLGVALAAWGVPVLLRLAPPDIPRLDRVGIDFGVVGVAAAAGLAAALIVGLIPALRYTRPASLASLRHGGRGGTDEPGRRRMRNGLVVLQTSLALVLLVGSGLLARSFTRLTATDLGFEPANVMTFRIALPSATYAERAAIESFGDELLRRLRELPGVEAAGATTVLPIVQSSPGTAREFENRPLADGQLPPMVHYKSVRMGYFDAMKIALRAGRDFHSGDFAEGTRHVIANQALAELYWPGEDPLGKRLRISSGGGPDAPPWFTVVGVVGNERQDGLRRPIRPLLYFTSVSDAVPGGVPRVYDFVVRGREIATRADELRREVWAIDRGLPVASMRTLDEIVSRSIVEFTFTMLTLAIAAAMALLLGAIGLYGVLSYAVTLRRREIGVRLALGASPGRVMRSVVANGAVIAGAGLIVGLAASFGLTRLLGNLLFEVEPFDPATVAAMSVALLVVAVVASYLPARRAASVSPTESMKAD